MLELLTRAPIHNPRSSSKSRGAGGRTSDDSHDLSAVRLTRLNLDDPRPCASTTCGAACAWRGARGPAPGVSRVSGARLRWSVGRAVQTRRVSSLCLSCDCVRSGQP